MSPLSRETVDGAVAVSATRGPEPGGAFWLNGFRSSMDGLKAIAVDRHCAARGIDCVRFDYRGHGKSGGRFEDLTVTDWIDDALAVYRDHARGPQIICGSSMGGWIALNLIRRLAAEANAAPVKALVLIAPAADMTERLIEAALDDRARAELDATGRFDRPSRYGDGPYPITRRLLDDGRAHRVLGAPIDLALPIRILQGSADADVPWALARALTAWLIHADVRVTLVPGGDHRLSEPADLKVLMRIIDGLIG